MKLIEYLTPNKSKKESSLDSFLLFMLIHTYAKHVQHHVLH